MCPVNTRHRDGTTHAVLEARDFIARLAALVPGPRSHLTRYHGGFAPHAKWGSAFVPGKVPPPAAERTRRSGSGP